MTFKKITCPVLLSFILCLSAPIITKSATIKGKVLDGKTKETLIGATVYNKEKKEIHDAAALDGSYSLKNVAPGTYTIVVEFFGYTTQEKSVTVANDADVIVQDFDMKPDSLTLKQVEIVGNYDKGTDNFARNEERISSILLNVISAKTIQLLPDITVGDVMQRVSGVTIERSISGGGKYALIRGMEKRYVLTEVNGVEIPSPNNNNRYVPLDIFPADIIDRLEVSKTLLPSMPGAATGGIINMVLKDAPDRFTLDVNVATGQNVALYSNPYYKFNSSVINSQSPAQQMGESAFAGLSIAQQAALFPTGDYIYSKSMPLPNILSGFTLGDRLVNGKLGVLFSVDYQNTYSSTNDFLLIQDEPGPGPNINSPNIAQFKDIESRLYSTQNEQEAAHLKLDYVLNRKHKISFYTVYFGLTQYRSDIYKDTDATGLQTRGPGIGEVKYDNETKVTEEHIYNATLEGTDTLAKNLSFDWTGAYSRAWQNTPDWGNISTYSGITEGSNGPVIAPDYWDAVTRRWLSNADNDFAGYANFNYKMKISGQDVVWTAGAMNRDKQRNESYDSYKFSFATNDVVAGTNPSDPSSFSPIPGIASATYSGINNSTSATDPNNYSLQEDVNAFYVQGKINIGPKIEVIGGLRNENTTESYLSNQSDLIAASYGTISYSDYLPSIEVTYALNPTMNLKASYYASTARPNFNEIAPFSIAGDPYTQNGNPYLKRTQADNLDLRYEFFPSFSEEILVGAFYKALTNPIEYEFTGTSTVTPENDTTSKATNYGFELQVMKKFLRFFEISGNYTYTKSQITVSEQELYYSSPGVQAQTNGVNPKINETRPLQGQAASIGNLSLIFKDPKIGLDAQLSAVYTGRLISQTSPYYDMDYWEMPMVKMDFSIEKRLSKKYKITAYAKILNILNTPYLIEMFPPSTYTNNPVTAPNAWLPGQSTNSGTLNSIIVEKETFGQSWLFGIRYKF